MAATTSPTPDPASGPMPGPSPAPASVPVRPPSRPWYRQLYFWVLTAIVCGILTGWLRPDVGVGLEPVGATFVSAIRMLITPIVFLTVVGGIGGVDSLRRAVMVLTSKGSGGVTGAGFIALAATLSSVGTVPAAGIMLIFGIDKFMSECRALTNLAGNSAATLLVARWEGALDTARVSRVLRTGVPEPAADPEPEPTPPPGHSGHDTGSAPALAKT
ncbi:cation:dicarboxylase symporter family transporter [Streptomyces sp. p1417]|uniref:Cation:dicarboxylase symporter family transporter n=1 Tax=Streptomyces typhae TaxID=2681492 RepID=A0A6L6WWL3_9ACTN|nr:cation:dicarboxylase symporter family transporter [Streptomyces typhae]MVO85804.1 cation:dicarboxylase symporter family transporter [Streptomyces typhae]